MRLLKSGLLFTLAVIWIGCQAATPAQRRRRISIPSGTEVQVRLNSQLDTGETTAGQTFTGTVAQPVVVGGQTALARGGTVHGRVVEVVSSGRLKRPASITLELTSPFGTQPLHIDGKSHLLRNAALIGGGAGAGALVGGLTGGKKGAAIGAAVGAGAGTATAYMTGKHEIVLPAETALPFVVGSAGSAPAAAAAEMASQAPERYTASRGPERGEMSRGGAMAQALVFTERDQRLIRSYYSGGGRGLPPGLAKRGGRLPPGLERQLQRNGTLPPGLQKRVQPFPAELTEQLPSLPSGYSRVILAGRALILDRNNRILDLMAMVR
jgi:hypothetical protein